jgi:hypothetical protein
MSKVALFRARDTFDIFVVFGVPLAGRWFFVPGHDLPRSSPKIAPADKGNAAHQWPVGEYVRTSSSMYWL